MEWRGERIECTNTAQHRSDEIQRAEPLENDVIESGIRKAFAQKTY